jgi:hypothetical protein
LATPSILHGAFHRETVQDEVALDDADAKFHGPLGHVALGRDDAAFPPEVVEEIVQHHGIVGQPMDHVQVDERHLGAPENGVDIGIQGQQIAKQDK